LAFREMGSLWWTCTLWSGSTSVPGTGWHIGRTERWRLLPGEEEAWPDPWLRYAEAAGIGLADLVFRIDAG
jgi:hypothetical protein